VKYNYASEYDLIKIKGPIGKYGRLFIL